MQKSLYASEWILVVSLLAILGSLFVIAKVNSYRAAEIVGSMDAGPPSTEVRVTVRGAAESIELVLPKGSRISDLKEKISLSAEADKTFFRRKRKLKDGEVIEVPKKTVE